MTLSRKSKQQLRKTLEDMRQEMLDEVQRFRDRGYRVHSCKVGADVSMDIQRINLLADNESEGEIMFYDVNRAWLPREAITVMNSVVENSHGEEHTG